MSTDTITQDGTKVDISVIDEVTEMPYEDDGSNSENFAHIINPPNNIHLWRPGMEMSVVVEIARKGGLKVTALCGKTWVPKRNPEKHPACQTCFDIAGELMKESGE